GQLLENGCKYSPGGGTVTVRARPSGEWIEVTVDDEGIGIAPGDHERIFERFVQGEAGDRRRFGGIGLGLYIVRQLARAQGGEVTAAPAPGSGTIMRLTLPRAADPAGASPPAVVADGVATEGGVEPTHAAPEAGQAVGPDVEAGEADMAAMSEPADAGSGAAPEGVMAAKPTGTEAEKASDESTGAEA